MNAVFINTNKNNEIKYLCNICLNELDEKGIGLKCNPTKHTFCYECILDWYSEVKNKKYSGNYTILCMCPICRQDGGKLPLLNENEEPIKGIHYIKKVVIPKDKCGAKLVSKNATCKNNAKKECNGLCALHFKIQQKELNKNNDANIDPNIIVL